MNFVWIVRVWISLFSFVANRKQTWKKTKKLCANTCAKCKYYRTKAKVRKMVCNLRIRIVCFILVDGSTSHLEISVFYVVFNILNHRPERIIIGLKVGRRRGSCFLCARLKMDMRDFLAHLIDNRVFYEFTIILCFCLPSMGRFGKPIMLN